MNHDHTRARALGGLRFSTILFPLLVLAACGGGGGGKAPDTNVGGGHALGMNVPAYADYANAKNKQSFLNRLAGTLPSSVDLRTKGNVPTPGDQGAQGSCVGWASAYGMKTIQEGQEERWNVADRSHEFSPAFVFNQIHAPNGQGSMPSDAMDLMVKKGCCTLATMPYTDKDFETLPPQAAYEEAAKFRAKRSIQVPLNEANFKTALSEGTPIVIGVMLYEPFQAGLGQGNRYGPEHVTGKFLGGHAMCLVGYDDQKGSFLALNSWGAAWGDNGFVWIDYKLLTTPFPGDKNYSVLAMAYTVEDGPNEGKQAQDFPSNLKALNDNPNFVALSWTEAQGSQGYKVQRSRDQQSWVDVFDNLKDTFANDAPSDFATYYYRVFGIKGIDNVSKQPILTKASETVQGKRSESGGGQAPSGVQATTNLPYTVEVTWSAFPGAQRYLVVRSENDTGGPYDLVDYLPGTRTTDLPPTQGKLYYYRVAAMLAQGLTPFSPAAEGRSGSQAAADLSADDMLYPCNQFYEPLPMQKGNRYSWPYWMVTNWSEQPLQKGRHLVLTGLFRTNGQSIESYAVAGWYMDPFPAEETVYAGSLPFQFRGVDLITQKAIPAGSYYWFVGFYLLDEQGRITPDSNPSDNEYYVLDRVRVN